MPSVALKEVASIQVGYPAKGKIREVVEGTHHLIQSKDFDSSHRLRIEKLISFLPERKPELYSVRYGDILFQARGTVHFAHCIEYDLKNTLAAGSFYILRIRNKSLVPQYLAWWMNQPRTQAWFMSHAGGSGISFISKSTLSCLYVQVPPLPDQKKVVKIAALVQHEKHLLDRLARARAQLANTICLTAIQQQEK